MKNCENCGSEHDGNYKSGRFCSEKCARGFSTKSKRKEINEKVSSALKGRISKKRGGGNASVSLICKNCESEFSVKWNKRSQKFCSISCGSSYRWENPAYKKYMSGISSKVAKERHSKKDPSFGWSTRKKLKPSYPESIAMRTLDALGIDYEFEMPMPKYFIDFAIVDMKIAIEIDGQQHLKAERKKTDLEKDTLLKNEGWTVYRIKWPSDNIVDSINSIFQGISSET